MTGFATAVANAHLHRLEQQIILPIHCLQKIVTVAARCGTMLGIVGCAD